MRPAHWFVRYLSVSIAVVWHIRTLNTVVVKFLAFLYCLHHTMHRSELIVYHIMPNNSVNLMRYYTNTSTHWVSLIFLFFDHSWDFTTPLGSKYTSHKAQKIFFHQTNCRFLYHINILTWKPKLRAKQCLWKKLCAKQ